MWILYVVLLVGGTERPTSFTAEHNTQAACEKAKESIRQKISNGRVVLLTCEQK